MCCCSSCCFLASFNYLGFRAGKRPDVYQLCHRDKTTVDRHASRHKDDLSQVDVKPYYDESVRKARE